MNFLDNELTESGISVSVKKSEIHWLLWEGGWEGNLEEIDDSEYDVSLEWGMVGGPFPVNKFGLVFLQKKIHNDLDFDIRSKIGTYHLRNIELME